MKINFNNIRNFCLKNSIKKMLMFAKMEENLKYDFSVNITFVSQDEIKDLNTNYRNVNRVTDVLSFPLYETKDLKKLKADEQADLGDIVICKDVAKKQAKEYGHSFKREVCFLSLHGFLHLLGYDHMEKDDEKIMFDKQDIILKQAKIERKVR